MSIAGPLSTSAEPDLSMNPRLLPFTDRPSGAGAPGLPTNDSEAILAVPEAAFQSSGGQSVRNLATERRSLWPRPPFRAGSCCSNRIGQVLPAWPGVDRKAPIGARQGPRFRQASITIENYLTS